MRKRILLGVDGGNTKTDFLLFTEEGECLARLRTGTCSHEALHGYEPAQCALQNGVGLACRKAGISVRDIDSAVLGLAGADTAGQHETLSGIAKGIFEGDVLVCNDSLLGIKAAIPNGTGICCINGTGASVSGIDEEGRILQVGGIGAVSSDYAGGGFSAIEVLRNVYSARYRDGRPTRLTEGVLSLLHADKDANLLELFHPDHLRVKDIEYELNCLLYQCAEDGDETAQGILYKMAETMAESTAGCIKNLRFTGTVPVVLAGSLWVRAGFPKMREAYCACVRSRADSTCEFKLLREPPALGAVLWAYERMAKTLPDMGLRKRFILSMQQEGGL